MNQAKNKKKTWFYKEMFESEAYRSIRTATALKILTRFYLKRQFENINGNHKKKKYKPVLDKDGEDKIKNNGKIEFTYSEAKRWLGITDKTFTRSIDELLRTGFIDITKADFGIDRTKTQYAISKRWEKFNTPDFVETKRPERPFKVGFQADNTLYLKRKTQEN